MITYAIGLFFIVAGLMMGSYGIGPLVVGIIICLVKFFNKYKSVDNFTWTKTFENSSLVKEIVGDINTKGITKIDVKPTFISYGNKTIKFSDHGIGELTIANCQTLANTIRNMMNNSSDFEVERLYKLVGGGGIGSDRPIGMTQTANGNFVFDYGDRGPSTDTTGYRIVPKHKKTKEVKKTTKQSEWK